jgi:transposase-like protein
MPSYGDEVACPGCGATHVVRVGEINPHRQIRFVCSSCGGMVTMEHDGSLAVVRPQNPGSSSRSTSTPT